jgi:hypothetical protein
MAINRSALMKKAHWNANWKRISGDKRAYREIFGEMLRLAWSQAKQAEEAKANYIVREQLREQQNFGLPLRSTPADYRRPLMGGSRYANAVGA